MIYESEMNYTFELRSHWQSFQIILFYILLGYNPHKSFYFNSCPFCAHKLLSFQIFVWT